MPAGRVAIAGGGIAGLATVIALRRAGLTAHVYERAGVLSDAGAAMGLHSNAVLALRALGVADQVVAAGQEVRTWEFRDERGERLTGWSQAAVSRELGAPGVTVPRAALQSALLDAVPDGAVVTGKELTGFTESSDGVALAFANGSSEHADVLIGADGLRSTVRRLQLGDGPPKYAGFTAWRGVCDRGVPAGIDPGLARQTLGPRATFGMWSLPGGRVYWVATLAVAEDDGSATDAVIDRKRLGEVFQGFHAPIPELIDQTPDSQILRTPIHDRDPRPGWSGLRTLRIGDAAHPMLPTTGQGGGQALLDALALAEALSTVPDLAVQPDVTAAFAAFEARRMPMTAGMAAEARRLGESHHSGDRAECARRDQELRDTSEDEWIRRMTRRAMPPSPVGGPR